MVAVVVEHHDGDGNFFGSGEPLIALCDPFCGRKVDSGEILDLLSGFPADDELCGHALRQRGAPEPDCGGDDQSRTENSNAMPSSRDDGRRIVTLTR